MHFALKGNEKNKPVEDFMKFPVSKTRGSRYFDG